MIDLWFRHRSFIVRSVFSFLVFTFPVVGIPQDLVRTEVGIPDVPGYVLMKCDFHTHTVFSDGAVWPTVRVDEAWRHGLDAISITDHIEYQPHKEDVPTNHNRPFELAEPRARELGLIHVRGAEITRKLPPGHFNAIFLADINPLDTEEYRDAIKAAIDQGAFVFWNHPPFGHPEEKSEWFPEHTELFEKGWFQGIEVVNGRTYYPEAHQWCLEKNLTMLCTSDIHGPMDVEMDAARDKHRPMTLVLAKEKTEAPLKEALFARRTVVYTENRLIGEEKYLRPIFEASVAPLKASVSLAGRRRIFHQIRNKSELDYQLQLMTKLDEISVPRTFTLYGEKAVPFEIRAKSENLSGMKKIGVPYVVNNLLIAPDKVLSVTLEFDATFIPE